MTPEEINKKVEQLHLLTDAKMKHLRDHSRFLDQAPHWLKVKRSGPCVILESVAESIYGL